MFIVKDDNTEEIGNVVGDVYGQLPPAPQTGLLKGVSESCRSAQEAGGQGRGAVTFASCRPRPRDEGGTFPFRAAVGGEAWGPDELRLRAVPGAEGGPGVLLAFLAPCGGGTAGLR